MLLRRSTLSILAIACMGAIGGVWLSGRVHVRALHETCEGDLPTAIDGQTDSISNELVLTACKKIAVMAALPPTDIVGATQVGQHPTLSPPIPAIDAEWQSFPRLAFHLSEYFRDSSEFEARVLFRHRRLNPRDLVIDRSEREMLREVLQVVSGGVQQLRSVQANIAWREALAVASREGHHLPVLEPKRSTVALQGGGIADVDCYPAKQGDVLLPRDGGGMFLVGEVRCPGAHLVREKQLFLITELVTALISYFECRGVCTRDEASDLQAEIIRELFAASGRK